MVGNHNNNIKDVNNSLKSGISLDAGALAKQTTQNKYTGNGVVQNGPIIQNSFLNANSGKYLNETEINC